MEGFWDSNVWSTFLLVAILLASLLAGNVLRRKVPFLRNSLIPTSVLGGLLLIGVAAIYKAITGTVMFDAPIFQGRGTATLEVITYHALALGFIASTLKSSEKKLSRERTNEIFNTGVTTVSTYLIQGIVGMAITIVAAIFIPKLLEASGLLLPFGYGQGSGQAMNYGYIYETDYGFDGGKSFGLTIAALGFLSASIGGVIHLNIIKRRGKIHTSGAKYKLNAEKIEERGEIPMQESIDKLTVQVALVAVTYMATYFIMYFLGQLIPGMKATIYGFNFLLGVICATAMKGVLKLLRRTKLQTRNYTNNFLLTRTSNFLFDIMIVAGIAAIRLDILESYWGLMLILGTVGLLVTYFYNLLVAKILFKHYEQEQFLMMYGMLTGTASTGMILLREIDPNFKTPAADNLVYQNFPAIAFGFPLMLIATFAPKQPVMALIILIVFFLVMNIILFRKFLFRHKKKTSAPPPEE